MFSLRRCCYTVLLLAAFGCGGKADYHLVILQTNDSHSHALGLPNASYDPTRTGDGTVGGFARVAALVKQGREQLADTLAFSAGDFTMGTLFVAAEGTAADMNLLTDFGFDAAALGNHEFDWGPAALARMITAAQKPLLPLLCANIIFSEDAADDSLAALYGKQGEAGKYIYPYVVLQSKSGTKVGVIGLLGLDAAAVANAKPVRFSKDMTDLAATAQKYIDILRNDEGVDAVVILAHLGLIVDGTQYSGETAELARKITGADVILSGHYHSLNTSAVTIPSQVAGSTSTAVTLEAGDNNKYLGRYELTRTGGTVTITGATIPIDDTIIGLADANTRMAALIADIEDNLLATYPLAPAAGAFLDGTFFQTLAHADFDLIRQDNDNNNLGYLAADAMRLASGAQLAAISNGGDLRESLLRVSGDAFDVADTFIVTPLGIGPDGRLGYPLAKFYLTLVQLKLAMEGTIADTGLINNDYELSLSGMRVLMDTRLDKYNRITKMSFYTPIDDSLDAASDTVIYDANTGGFPGYIDPYTTFVSVCTSSYIAQFLVSFGLAPYDAAGNPVSDLSTLIVRDNSGDEVKLWYTLQERLASFGTVPDLYNDDEFFNPAGPYWRRAWDIARHGQP
jgi:5'-nucleotidase / UDP-sugar diphosphatase